MQSNVTLIIPCFQSESRILKTIEHWQSHFHFRQADIDFILVDDHSPVESWDAFISSLSTISGVDVQVYRLRKNFGQSFATCFGLSVSKSTVNYVADDDLKADATVYDQLAQAMSENKSQHGFISFGTKRLGIVDRLGSLVFNFVVSRSAGYSVSASNHRIFLGEAVPRHLSKYLHPSVFIDFAIADVESCKNPAWVIHHPVSFPTVSRYSLLKKVRMFGLMFNAYINSDRRDSAHRDTFVETYVRLPRTL